MPTNMTLSSITAILILSTDDRSRILTKYYSPPHLPPPAPSFPSSSPSSSYPSSSAQQRTTQSYSTPKEQKAFEKGLLDKTNKQSGDVILYDGHVVVYKMEGDVMLYVVGGGDENEILLFGVVLALRDALAILLKNSTDKRTLIENYDLVALAMDEIVDDGIILEIDPVVVASRVTKPPAQDVVGVKGIDLSEQGLANAWEMFKAKGVERMRQF